MKVKGEIRVDYFHLECGECSGPHNHLRLSKARWVGGVPQVVMTCPNCGATDDVKLHPTAWMDVIPLP
jgi:hypothetical protein